MNAVADSAAVSTTRPRVLYIGGVGRSGSTLLAGMLSQLPQTQLVGELVHIWDRGVVNNELCECGALFRACEFWTRVGAAAFGGWSVETARDMLELKQSVDRTRYVPLMVAPSVSSSYSDRLSRYSDALRRLFSAVHEVSGARIVVDSSKHVSYAYVLRQMPGVDVSIIHLVRDSRGVAFSWTRKVRRIEITDAEEFMPQYSPARVAVRWDLQNILFTALKSRRRRLLRSRYEDLAKEPRREFERVLRFGGLDGNADLGFIHGHEIDLRPSHSIGGNPMRFEQGPTKVRVDERWKTEMRPRDRAVVDAITLPLMRAYGYGREAQTPR